MDTLSIILEVMNQKGIKQNKLTEYLGIHKNAFSNWKSGRNTSYLKYLPQIAEFLDVSVNYLLGLSDKPNYEEGTILSEQEKAIINQYRSTTEEGRLKIITAIMTIVREEEEEKTYKVKIAARNGSFEEKTLTKQEVDMIKNLPDVDDL